MKKVLLTAAFMVCAMVASAQLYVGGGLGITREDFGNDDKTVWSINPEIGYTLNDNWAFGVAFGYSDGKKYAYLDDPNDFYEASEFKISPYARYTFLRTGAFSVFADGAVDLIRHKPEGGEAGTEWGIAVKPGIAYAINENFSVVAHLGALGYWDYDDDHTKFSLELDNNLSFGLYYSF